MAYSDNPELAAVEKAIRSCLIAQKGALSVNQLNSDYRNQEEENIPYRKFGYNTLLDFLSSLKHVLRISTRNGEVWLNEIETDKTRHVSSLVKHQNTAKRNKKTKFRHYSNGNNCHRQFNRGNNSRMTNSRSENERNPYVQLRATSNNSSSSSSNSNDQNHNQATRETRPSSNGYQGKSAETKKFNQGSSQMPPTSENHLNDNSFARNDNSPGIAALIHPRIIERLRELIEKHEEGIWCADLAQKYADTFEARLNYTDLGFQSVHEFASYLPNVFHCIRVYESGDFKLFNAKKPAPAITEIKRSATFNQDLTNNNSHVTAFPKTLESKIARRLIPDDVMSPNESVGQINVKDLPQEYVAIEICELFSPTYFFVHLREGKRDFDTFMRDLHTFYEEKKLNYQIPPVLLKTGLNVACIFNTAWHRALVKSVSPEGQVRVHFYDYGTVKSYDKSEMYFLHKSFSHLPAQAILFGLYNVKPIRKTEWDRSVGFEMLHKAKRPLIAIISSTNEEENSALVSLTDTHEKEDVHINDWLISENYATLGQLRSNRNRNFVFMNYKKCLEHKGYDSKKLPKNTKKPVLNNSSKFNDSQQSGKTNESPQHRNHQEKNENIPSPLNLNISVPPRLALLQKLRSSNPKKLSETKIQENNNFEEKISSPKILQKTFAMYSKIQEKKEAENILSPLSSSIETSGSSQYLETTKSPDTNSPISTKSESRREMLLRFVNQSRLAQENKSKNPESRVRNSEEKIVDISPEAKKSSSDEASTPGEESQSPTTENSDSDSYSDRVPLHFKEQSQTEDITEFGTFKSEFGGNKNLTPMNWTLIREDIKKSEIKKSVSQIRSNSVNEEGEKLDNGQLKSANSTKSGETNANEVPKLNIVSKKSKKYSSIQPELSRYNNFNSNFSNMEYLFTSSANIKSSETPISPLIKLKQRIHSNSIKTSATFISPKIIENLTGGVKEAEKNDKTLHIDQEDNDSLEIRRTENMGESSKGKVKNTQEIPREIQETCPKIPKIVIVSEVNSIKENGFQKAGETLEPTEKIPKSNDSNCEQNKVKSRMALLRDKLFTKKIEIEEPESSESLDSDDYSEELLNPKSNSDSTISAKSINGRESKSTEKKPIGGEQAINIFNDLGIASDDETWDGMSFSGEIAPVRLTRSNSLASQAPLINGSTMGSTIDLTQPLDNDMNFQYNDVMSRKKQQENLKKEIQSQEIERNLPSSSNSSISSKTENCSNKNFIPPGRSQSLLHMLMNMKKASKYS